MTHITTHITIRVIMMHMAMKKHIMTHITNRLIMIPMDMTHITIQVIMTLMLHMAMKNHIMTHIMTHITNRLTMTHITNRLTMTHITKQVITDVIGTVTCTQCCKSHVGSKQNINITHKTNICTETL
jgi:hypothetical protein